MKPSLSISLFIVIITFSGCFDFDLFPENAIVFEGRIVEAFDSTKPIDSVIVQGCTQQLALFPTWPSCDTETLTDNDGHFNISVKADDLTGAGISYGKEGYKSLDSCITLGNGKMECYIEQLPTVFYIYSPTKTDVPFVYDSLIAKVSTEIKDTTVYYITNSYLNTQGGNSYYWTNKSKKKYNREQSYTYIYVPDNSKVTVEAHYFKNQSLIKIDTDTLFCPKGVGNKYRILDN